LADFATLWIAASSAIFVGSISYIVLWIDNDTITHFFSKPLYPGFYVAYRLVYAHADASDRMVTFAVFAAALVNALVYLCGVLIIRLLWRYMNNPNSLRPYKSEVQHQSNDHR
jgi:hypothetical protein